MRHRPRLTSLCALAWLGIAGTCAADVGDISLVGFDGLPGSTRITNVWGYHDYQTGGEFALVGDWYGGFFIVDVSDPSNPQLARRVLGVPGFDLKPYGHHVYSCDGNQIGRDTRITDIANPYAPIVLPTTLPSCHTLSVSTLGVLYAEYPGVRIFDVLSDPANPDSLAHIMNLGHDSTPRGFRLYDFNGGALNIWDVSNPHDPSLIGSDDDPSIGYYHSGDESKDHNYLYVCDEYAVTPAPDIIIYDISDPSAPARIGEINDPTSRVHQLYVNGDFMFVGYYTAGFKVFDISNPAAPLLLDSYDTSPYQAEEGSDIYNGAYNAYPYASSGIVYVSDHPTGLFLFSVEGYTGTLSGAGDTPRARDAVLEQNTPNPFNPSTSIAFQTFSHARVTLRVYDVRGACVRTLVDEPRAPGTHRVVWDGTGDAGRASPSGIYYYRLEAGASSVARRMVLLK